MFLDAKKASRNEGKIGRHSGQNASEAYSFNLSDTSGNLRDILVGSIPEAKKEVTCAHTLALMLEVEKIALLFDSWSPH